MGSTSAGEPFANVGKHVFDGSQPTGARDIAGGLGRPSTTAMGAAVAGAHPLATPTHRQHAISGGSSMGSRTSVWMARHREYNECGECTAHERHGKCSGRKGGRKSPGK